MKKKTNAKGSGPQNSRDERDLDIVLFGATGYTGYLIAKYLVENYGINEDDAPLRWAIAGRNRTKLQLLHERLGVWDAEKRKKDATDKEKESDNASEREGKKSDADHVEIIIADSSNEEQLRQMTRRTRVVIAAVGPYTTHGLPLVRACVETKTDYVDLAGELPFIRESIDSFHESARADGVRIIHSCGFDALPSDIGALELQEFVVAQRREPADSIQGVIVKASGSGISSGTASSIATIFEWADEHPDEKDLLTKAYPLNDEVDQLPDIKDIRRPLFDPFLNVWLAPFPTSPFNERIVRRSNELLGFTYGRRFIYQEATQPLHPFKNSCSSEEKGGIVYNLKCAVNGLSAGIFTLGVGGGTHLLMYETPRSILRNFSKYVADYPGEPKKKDGELEMVFSARVDNQEFARLTLTSDLDPGYTGTAVMISEAAIALALDHDKLRGEGGVLTPASGLNDVIRPRLELSGHFSFHVERVEHEQQHGKPKQEESA